MQLPTGKIPAIWEIFLTDFRTTFVPPLQHLVPAVREGDQSAAAALSPILFSLSHAVHLFVAFLDSVMLANTTAPTVLNLVTRALTELVGPVLSLAIEGRRTASHRKSHKCKVNQATRCVHFLLNLLG